SILAGRCGRPSARCPCRGRRRDRDASPSSRTWSRIESDERRARTRDLMTSRARGCLVACGVALALLATVAALLGPGLVHRAHEIYAPISRMKGEQRQFEAW